jgi:hypothetical protein
MERIIMTTELERLADETLEYLCKDYSGNVEHRVTMRASFEIFRNHLVFREYCEFCKRTEKMNIINGMRLLNHG